MVVCDIETLAVDGIDIEPVSAPANYTRPEAIADYIAKAEAKQRDKAGLYPYTARVIALGWCYEGDETAQVHIANGDAMEREILAEFWGRVWDRRTNAVESLVTFNGRSFDLPVLMVRSRLLGVPYPALNIDRYRSPHPDILKILTFDGALDYRSLTWFARRFGLNTDDAFSGKEIAELHAVGNWDAIKKHCESDVLLTRQLGERIGLLKPLVRA